MSQFRKPTYRSDNPVVGLAAILVWLMLMLGIIAFSVGLLAAKVWLIASLVTSGVKAGTSNCHVAYPVEKVLSGNWFCPAKE